MKQRTKVKLATACFEAATIVGYVSGGCFLIEGDAMMFPSILLGLIGYHGILYIAAKYGIHPFWYDWFCD